jgi:hypothetical protein
MMYIFMAEIKSIKLEDDHVILCLRLSRNEYDAFGNEKELLVFPVSDNALNEVLVTGKLGNGNRIMVPNKLLERHSIPKLIKNVKSKIFSINKRNFLLISLDEKMPGIPLFKEESK